MLLSSTITGDWTDDWRPVWGVSAAVLPSVADASSNEYNVLTRNGSYQIVFTQGGFSGVLESKLRRLMLPRDPCALYAVALNESGPCLLQRGCMSCKSASATPVKTACYSTSLYSSYSSPTEYRVFWIFLHLIG